MELMTKLKDKIIPWRRKAVEHRDLLNLRDDINRVFDRFFFSPFEGDEWAGRMWGSDEPVVETSEGVIARVEVPGVDPKDLAVTVRDGILHIQLRKRMNGDGRMTIGTAIDMAASIARCRCLMGSIHHRPPRRVSMA